MTAAHDPALTTLAELVDHVKAHLTPDMRLDHLSDYDVHAIIGFTLHSVLHFGLTLVPVVPASSGGGSTPPTSVPLEVGAPSLPYSMVEYTVPVALELVAWSVWRSVVRRLADFLDWLDARLEASS